ncbi:uncharacterized protein LOC129924937 [Biomphalaria glabrata]|uniref:Uncharacterized protein LOC129924937 n=1 Tax=Biomphalaria glabrata TaxID=6526 RepID=A0A9W2ZTR9_BIOGL|nr:uncharacterized protein LOC129924937 [Biomphalaria glabrata]KAI8740259.1 hypothetical protein BgiMline_023349 [Biomphalaria glabrata]
MSLFVDILVCNTTVSGVCGRKCYEYDQCSSSAYFVSLQDDTWLSYNTIKSTYVILFYLIVAPLIGAILFFCWKGYEDACEHCDSKRNKKADMSTPNYKLKYECCKRNVAPILFPIPPDFDFKHHCGQNCLGPNKIQQPRYI